MMGFARLAALRRYMADKRRTVSREGAGHGAPESRRTLEKAAPRAPTIGLRNHFESRRDDAGWRSAHTQAAAQARMIGASQMGWPVLLGKPRSARRVPGHLEWAGRPASEQTSNR
jgi:hypothetical protein